MRILRISLRNIASLEGTHTVDFTRDPLRAAGLFSISGITGSGKSSLLDALCLALYERTPRLNAIRGAVKLADGGESISQKDPANLLRRGTGDGFAEVAFVGVDDKAYTARWTVRRAHGRPEGALQNPEMTLFVGDVPAGTNGVIECGGRRTEVLPVIAAKVGLSFEQFTRAVLLAQNEFATFLKADDQERAEILQALTGTERFEAISVAVFTRCSEELHAVSDLEGRLAGNAPLAPEDRRQAESACASAEGAWKEADAVLAAREAHAAWFARGVQLSRNASEAEIKLDEARKSWAGAAPRRLNLQHTEQASREARPLWDAERRTIDETTSAERFRHEAAQIEAAARIEHDGRKKQHDEAASALATAKAALNAAQPHLRLARELDAILPSRAERLTTAIRDREGADGAVQEAIARREALLRSRECAETEQTLLVPKRAALAALSAFAPEATAWLDRLDRTVKAGSLLREAERILAERAKQERDKEAAATAERARAADADRAAAAAQSAWEKAEAAARTHDGEKIATLRRAAETARVALHGLEDDLRLEDLRAEFAKLRAGHESECGALVELKERLIPAAKDALDAARRSFELAQAAVADAAIGLREKLAPHLPCPVCGALDHPYAGHPPASEGAALRALRDDCTAKEKETCDLRDQAARLDAARQARLKRMSELLRSIEALASAGVLRHEHPATAAILALPHAERAAALKARLTAEAETLISIEAADQARRDAERFRDACLKNRDDTAGHFEELAKKLRTIDQELAGLRAAREAAAEARGKDELACRASLGELTPLFTGITDAGSAWERDAAAFRESFASRARQFLGLEKRAHELAALIRETGAALGPVLETLTGAEAMRKNRQGEEAEARAQDEALRAQRAAIFDGRAADAIETELNATLRQATEIREACANKLADAGKHLAATAGILRGSGETLVKTTARRAAATVALDAWLAGFAAQTGHTLDRHDLEKMLERDDAWIRTERAALDALGDAVNNAQGMLTAHQQTLGEHIAIRPTEDDEPTVTTEVGALRTARQQVGQQRDSANAFLLADDQRIKNSVELARQLRERRALAEPWIKLNELIGSANGAKFRSIAQRRTLDILLGYANAQLEQLAARYRLERLPESLNLIVLDHDMGDERRSVHSLSGGESFLVSLALALALASLTSNRLRIESLFIDEGFGSLDPETLNTALNALMHLEAQGRKVGIISHVSELTDAIPVQIRVVKGRSGASRLIVPGARATTDTLADSGAGLVEEQRVGQSTAATGEIATQILGILRREQAAGRTRVSVRGLREEIGCGPSEFNAARDALLGQVRIEGRSLTLA